jgi:hypothetical protein
MMLQSAALHRGVPFGTNFNEIAKPSGIFCSAITIVIRMPRGALAPQDTHIAIPSAPECIVITIIRMNACFQDSFLGSVPVACSCLSANALVNIIKTNHMITPSITALALLYHQLAYQIPW